jgi:signal transduction histidine kinase
MPLALRSMDLRKVARKAQETLEPSASAAEITVKVSAPKRLPHIVADQEKIERVMINLIDNALRYTPRGGQITVRIQSQPTHQTISVIDSGDGIAPEYRERVFERFFQLSAKSRKRGSKGTGLGLTFCRLAVEAHQGRIWVDEAPGGGAAFHFTLPTDLAPTPNLPA